ncbi:hypothetical protein [Bosea sp. NBC_00550]|uniref:hypothetical protein n=1 Tax=Bosea sp. NBC_00550 TaxID=2969621 RepID=UPI00222E1E41|nr:hypothetical protein [Bosea sp. NBC_00550]UZF95405.1 hypothetical protein NWE53_23735 [Bosea sp. NBC_00550]
MGRGIHASAPVPDRTFSDASQKRDILIGDPDPIQELMKACLHIVPRRMRRHYICDRSAVELISEDGAPSHAASNTPHSATSPSLPTDLAAVHLAERGPRELAAPLPIATSFLRAFAEP